MNKAVLCTYHYDPLDRLTGTTPALQSGRLRFYCQHRIATEIQGTAQHSIMQHGNQLLAQHSREPTHQTTTLLASDLQRSVLSTVTGDEQLDKAYSPYGHTSDTHTHHLSGFNGERLEPITGHYLLGNGYRAFNPVLMRFNSPDSWSPFGKGGFNRYSYCQNNPVNYRDPSGHFLAHVSDFFATGGIFASILGIVSAISSPARTSGSAIVAYAAGALGILHGAVAASAPGTAIGAVMATSSASLGAVSTRMGVRAQRAARQGLSNRGSLNAFDAMENGWAQPARVRPNRRIEAPPGYQPPLPGFQSSPPNYESLPLAMQRDPRELAPDYTPLSQALVQTTPQRVTVKISHLPGVHRQNSVAKKVEGIRETGV